MTPDDAPDAEISGAGTDQAPVGRLRQESPLVDAVCRELERLLPPDEAVHAVTFAQIFLAKAPPDFQQERPPEVLTRVILGAYRFLERQSHEKIGVEVFNPTLEREGWEAPVTVVRTDVSERAFIVDTIREHLHSEDLAIEWYIYPIVHVVRAGGRIVELRPFQEGRVRESVAHCEIQRIDDPAAHERIRAGLVKSLNEVVAATDDFQAMLSVLGKVASELRARGRDLPQRRRELDEIRSFLRWLEDGGFVFLGYRAYDLLPHPKTGELSIQVHPRSGLGILRLEERSTYSDPVPVSEVDEGLRRRIIDGPTLIISKTNAEARVHRRARMDYIGIKRIDEEGELVGEHRFVGLFTSHAYGEEAENIPMLREKLRQILETAGVQEGSHDYKEINTIFNSMPKEELFLASASEIGADIRTVLTSYNTAGVKVTLREDRLHRGVSAMVILPKDKFSGDARRAIQDKLVQTLEGEVLNYHLSLGSGDQARLHFALATPPERVADSAAAELEAAVEEMIRSWSDRLREALEATLPPDEARRQAKRYGEAFSPEYRAATDPADAVQDIEQLEGMQANGRTVWISFRNRKESVAAPGVQDVTELELYLRGGRLVLSDFMPSLENVGLRVIAVIPFEVGGSDVPPALLYTFAVQDSQERPLDVASVGDLLAETLLAVRSGDASDDRLNTLVVKARMHWREVDVLRACASYLFQLRAVPSRVTFPEALGRHPHVGRLLFELFEARFDPDQHAGMDARAKAAQAVHARLDAAMKDVTLLADDRAFTRMAALIDAALRTNYYLGGGRTPTRRSGGVPYTSIKFATHHMDSVARTRLLCESWVRSSRVEAIHLRGSKVSRGGIRWSDRPYDFRTEVLGLVKTQVVKNAVIVPGGAKGGFVPLRASSDPEKVAEEGREQYRTLVRGLLDFTDNLDAEGRPVPPERVVCYDEPDPYLVVAADKGTAKFSDLANSVAAEYGFWLGDAFASGGSHGYDHKKVGITARGGWECVKRHFREMGKDVQREPFTAIGIGDMGGDVFGNGMLRSRQTRLLAAFDHRHVFIDPDPDPEVSFVERERIFALPRSSWDDYDRSKLSKGGMIVARGVKEVDLTREARAALGLPEDTPTLDGEGLIRAVMRAPVELLWNGGIGTYVKCSEETHQDAGDPTNDAVRVDATELRCKVVGEGGNLGFTQGARIEYALAGGRINTDALDNSGGVDLSDREVNLKILLNAAVRSGKLTMEARNQLLFEMTDAVAELVLTDNRSQSLAISLDEARAADLDATDDFRDLMTSLEKAGMLDRASEQLPSLEVLVDRQQRGRILVRPELCVLLAYAKLHLKSEILKSDLPDDPAVASYLTHYFPSAVAVAGEDALAKHRLRREIIASQITNDCVDLMGSAFVHTLMRSTGRGAAEVARAWLVGSRLAGYHELVKPLLGENVGVPAPELSRWLLGLSRLLMRTTRWVLFNAPADQSTMALVSVYQEPLKRLRQQFPKFVAGDDRALFETLVGEMRTLGASEDLASSLVALRFLDQMLEILRVAKESGSDAIDTARAFYRVSELLRVPWLRNSIFEAATSDRWEQRAAEALADDLTRAHHNVVDRVMRTRAAGKHGSDVVHLADRVVESRQREMARFEELLDELGQEPELTLSGLSVAVREIAALSERLNGI